MTKDITAHVKNPITRLIIKMSLRKCRGCREREYHTHHFTPIGRYFYTGSWFKK